MDHIQTERMREQIRREERTLEAWTLRYLSDEARSQYSEDLSKREGQYPPAQIWTGGPVQQLLEPTAEELAEEAARARELADRGQVKPDRHVLTRPPLDLTAPLPPGYIRSSRLTHDTRTESILQDLSPALVCPGAVYVKQRFSTSTADAYKYQRDKLDHDQFIARDKYALRRTWAQQHAEKCLKLGEKPFLSGSTRASGGGK